MEFTIIEKENRHCYYYNVDISVDEMNEWVENEYKVRLNAASDEDKNLITKKTPKELIDEINKLNDTEDKRRVRERKMIVNQYRIGENGEEVDIFDLIADTSKIDFIENDEIKKGRMETNDKTKKFLSLLTEKQKKRCELYYGYGLSTYEISEIEGVSHTAILDSIRQIRKKLKKFLKSTF